MMGGQAVDVSGMLTTDEAAKYLGMPRVSVQSWINRGHIDSVKVKGRRYLSQEALDDFIKRRKDGLKMTGTGPYRRDGMCEGKRNNEEERNGINSLDDSVPWTGLAAAIVKTGIQDYRSALRKSNWDRILYFEKWIRSQYVEFLTMGTIDPDYVIKRERQKYLKERNG